MTDLQTEKQRNLEIKVNYWRGFSVGVFIFLIGYMLLIPEPAPVVEGDLNGDGVVDIVDWSIIDSKVFP
jgi:hypothetical protein